MRAKADFCSLHPESQLMKQHFLPSLILTASLLAILPLGASAQSVSPAPVTTPTPAPATSLNAPAPIGQMPIIQAETLSERKVTLPQDLPGEKTLALIAFTREQQTNVNTWIQGMSLNTATEPWVELPVVGPQNSLMRSFTDGGMRMGIRDEAMRNRVITLYTDRAAFVKALGFKNSTRTIYVAVINRAGQVLASVEGDYTSEKAAVLTKALGRED